MCNLNVTYCHHLKVLLQQYCSFVNVILFLCAVGDVYTDMEESRWMSKFDKFVLYLKEPR